MIKTIEIGDLQLHNNTVRESIMLMERAIEESGFVAMEEVTIRSLLYAVDDEKVKDGLEEIDHTVIADTSILDAVKKSNRQRKFEIEDHTFFFELLKRLERNGKSVYMLGEKRENLDRKISYIRALYPKLSIVGSGTLEECRGAAEMLVNDINGVAADVIISMLPSPQQEIFLFENKGMLSASLWYGMGEIDPQAKRPGILARMKKRRLRKALEKQL